VMALSWSPSWCRFEGEKRRAAQCDPEADFGFVLHGLWPQYEFGWPSYCRTSHRDPSRAQTRDMSDIMGTSGLAWHQWKKHGTCAGLSAQNYFDLSREAYEKINRPKILRQIGREIDVQPSVIKEAFLEANPKLSKDAIEITCKSGNIQEARICLTKQLDPIACTTKRGSCGMETYDLPPIR